MSSQFPQLSYKTGFARGAGESEMPGLWRGLDGYWATSLGPTGDVLHDQSGHRRLGLLRNMEPATDWVPTERGYALDLVTNDFVDTDVTEFDGNSLFAETASRFTVMAWVDPHTTGTVVGKAGGTAGNRTFQIWCDGSYNVRLRGTTTAYSGLAFNDGKLHQCVVTWDGTTAQFYFDGRFIGAPSVGAAAEETTEDILFGARTSGTPSYRLDGRLGDIAIASRAWTASEISASYSNPGGLLRKRRLIATSPAAPAAGTFDPNYYYRMMAG